MEANPDISEIIKNITTHIEFKNCTLASEFSAIYWRIPDLPLFSLTHLLRESVRPYFSRGNHSLPTDWELLKWFGDDLSSVNSTILESVREFVRQECLDELCSRLGGRGDADIAGVGMLINYTIMAILTTFYWICLSRSKLLSRFIIQYLPDEVLFGAKYSVRIALDTAIVFSLSMLSAAICTSAKALSSRSRLVNLYSSEIANYLALWSVFPVLLLQHSASNSLRRTRSRLILYIFMLLLVIIEFALWTVIYELPHIFKWDGILKFDTDLQAYYNDLCSPTEKWYPIFVATLVLASYGIMSLSLIIVMTWPGSLSTVVSWLDHHFPILKKYVNCNQEVLLSNYHQLQGPLSCIVIWVHLAEFVFFHLQHLAKTDPSDEEGGFSFGQILSSTTWLPVLVDCGYIYLRGPKDALTGTMVKPYCAEVNDVVDSSQAEISNSTQQEVMAATESAKEESSEE